jgi:hypothetical protein
MVFEFDSLTKLIADYNTNLFLAEKYHVVAKDEKVFDFKSGKGN